MTLNLIPSLHRQTTPKTCDTCGIIKLCGERKKGQLTKCDVAVTHPGRDGNVIVRHKPRNLVAGENVPDDGGLVRVVANHVSTRASLAHVIDRDEDNGVRVALEASLERERVVMEAEHGGALGVQQHRRRRGARVEVASRTADVDGALVASAMAGVRRRRRA